MQLILTIAAGLLAVVAVVGVTFVVGMRRKAGFVQGPIIWLGRNGFNKAVVRTAGRPGTATAIVRNVGRTSGRTFETPVDVVAAGDGFLVALPYGMRSQWLRNVLAAGGATIVFEGQVHVVDSPEVIALGPVAAAFPESDRRMFRIFNVTQALRVRRVSTEPLPADTTVERPATRAA